MSGYCATGSASMLSAPPIVITMEMTDAKIGRSIQKREMFIGAVRSSDRVVVGLTLGELLFA